MKALILVLSVFAFQNVFADATVGQPAPDFSVAAQDGKTYKLSDFKGQTLVLEWYNQGCPYVRKHYDSKNMQTLQKANNDGKKITWLTVISSAKGKQGYLDAKGAAAQMKTEGMASKALLLDSTGTMGKAYGAKTTPHMYIVNSQGVLVYAGAIDSNTSSNAKDIPTSTNYVQTALNELQAGKPVTTASTKPYGCGVKYE